MLGCARFVLQAGLLQGGTRLVGGHVGEVRHGDLLGSLRDLQVDLRALGLLRACLRGLADDLAFLDLVAVHVVDRADGELHVFERRRGLGEGLVRYVGNFDIARVGRASAAEQDECQRRGDGKHGDDADGDEHALLAAALLGFVFVDVAHAAAGLEVAVLEVAVAARNGHDRGLVGLIRGDGLDVGNGIGDERRLRAAEPAQVDGSAG